MKVRVKKTNTPLLDVYVRSSIRRRFLSGAHLVLRRRPPKTAILLAIVSGVG